MRLITIPSTANPFVVTINNKTYEYPAGAKYPDITLPDEIVALIDAINAEKPTEAKMPGKVGQVVTRTEEGCAWEDAPTELPEFPKNASAGQRYKLTASKSIGGTKVTHSWEADNSMVPVRATPAIAGLVKMSTAVADATSETLLQQFNALLAAMRTAGQLDVGE